MKLAFKISSLVLFVALMVIIFMPASSFAFEETSPFTVKIDSRYIISSDVSSMTGEVQVQESSFSLDYDYKLAGQLPVTFSLRERHVDIKEDIPVDLPSH